MMFRTKEHREESVLGAAQAIHESTGRPPTVAGIADRLGAGRGIVRGTVGRLKESGRWPRAWSGSIHAARSESRDRRALGAALELSGDIDAPPEGADIAARAGMSEQTVSVAVASLKGAGRWPYRAPASAFARRARSVARSEPDRARVGRMFDEHREFAVRVGFDFVSRRRIPKSAMTREEVAHLALIGLWEAAVAYDESRGVDLETSAVPRIRGRIIDELRAERGRGLRGNSRGRHEPVSVFGDSWDGDDAGGLAYVPAGGSPVGWEVEYRDWVESLASRIPTPRAADLFRAAHLDGSGLTQREAGERIGVCPSRACQLHAEAVAALRATQAEDALCP